MNVTIVVHAFYILHKAILHKVYVDSDNIHMYTITLEQILRSTENYR